VTIRGAVVTGAGGFIGGHLVKRLYREGYFVRAVDIKPLDEWFQVHSDVECIDVTDVGNRTHAESVVRGADVVYNLAADMGGMGFIAGHKLACMLSTRASTEVLMAAANAGVDKYFFASSACVYPGYRQTHEHSKPLAEEDAYPADPEDGYGWEKLFAERMATHVREETGMQTVIGRYHNVYGPHGTWDGGREKAPAAMCRKVAQAVVNGQDFIEVWGDGHATRTYMYIDDCIDGTRKLMESGYPHPLNLGSDYLISVDNLARLVATVAGVPKIDVRHVDGPQGVRGRCSDNTRVRKVLDWEPSALLVYGIEKTYDWIFDQVKAAS
jgi:GDP-D-mannose 3',5'-epimerase